MQTKAHAVLMAKLLNHSQQGEWDALEVKYESATLTLTCCLHLTEAHNYKQQYLAVPLSAVVYV